MDMGPKYPFFKHAWHDMGLKWALSVDLMAE
jgi:hypothetical protein